MTRKAKERPPRLDAPTRPLAPRALSEAEQSLWSETVQAAKPLKSRPRIAPTPVNAGRLLKAMAPERPPPERAPSASQSATDPMQATLDRTWDRKLASGEVLPDLIIDLHGHALAQAHGQLVRGLHRATMRRARLVLLITGKGQRPDPRPLPPDSYRGVLRDAVPVWLREPELRALIAAVRPSHIRHGGEGAFYIVMKRVRGAG